MTRDEMAAQVICRTRDLIKSLPGRAPFFGLQGIPKFPVAYPQFFIWKENTAQVTSDFHNFQGLGFRVPLNLNIGCCVGIRCQGTDLVTFVVTDHSHAELLLALAHLVALNPKRGPYRGP